MRLAFISDIHANIHALRAVWMALKETPPDYVFCLGDIVGYGATPKECIQFLEENEVVCGAGISDLRVAFDQIAQTDKREGVSEEVLEWTRDMLNEEEKDFLRHLAPSGLINTPYGRLYYCHGSPSSPAHRMSFDQDPLTLSKILQNLNCKILMCGGNHVPTVRQIPGGYLIDPGSVGLTLNREPGADLCLLEFDESNNINIKIKKIRYDVHAAAFDILAWSLPAVIAEVVKTGRNR